MEGIVIRAHPSGNYDLVLHLILKESGKLACFASNARRQKKSSSFPELFDCCNFEIVPGKGDLFRIKHFQQKTSFPGLRTDLLRLSIAATVCECTDFLIPEAEEIHSEENYRIIHTCFTELEKEKQQGLMLKNCYSTLLSLLALTGFEPEGNSPPPTRNNLVKLMRKIERTTERELKSKIQLIDFLKSL